MTKGRCDVCWAMLEGLDRGVQGLIGPTCARCRHWESQVRDPWPGLVDEFPDCWRRLT
jgi:hypothetical protein